MKRKRTIIGILATFLLALAAWYANSAEAASGKAGAAQRVGEPFRVPAIAAGGRHSLALKSDGTVITWGDNTFGQTNVPAGLSGVTAIAAGGYHSLALKSDGMVVAWGDNQYGQTNVPAGLGGVTAITAGVYQSLALKSDGTVVAWGDNQYGQTNVPAGLSGVTAIAGGHHSLALKSDGTVIAWGDNTLGQTNVPAGLSGVTAIAGDAFHSLALKSDGTVVAWGLNNSGETNVPANLGGVTAIAAGLFHSLALKSDGTVVAWGLNSSGETNVPANLGGVTAISAGFNHNLALKSDGTVVGWGDNTYGQTTIPAGLTTGANRVVAWGRGYEGQTNVPANLGSVKAIAAGSYHSLALKSDGTVVAWGENNSGEVNVPAGLSGVTAIAAGDSHSLALKSDGTVVAWGENNNGRANVPAGLSGVTAIAAGEFHSLALKSDGTVVAWGYNPYGETNVPANLSGVSAIAAGLYYSLALKSDGTVVAWGGNQYGQTNVPAGLGGVMAIAGGGTHSLALKSDGTVVAWGGNATGQTDVPSGLSGVTMVAAGASYFGYSLALKSDGTIVAWGNNAIGQTNVPSGLGDVTAIAAGGAHSLALSVVYNRTPTITSTTLARTAGSPGSSSQIATVGDLESGAGGVTVTVTSANPSNGVTLSNIVNNNGTVRADVVAACGATNATFTLRATDGGGLTTDASLIVTVNPNTPPVLSYAPQSLPVGTTPMFSSSTGPSDNGAVNSILLQSVTPATGLALSVENTTGKVMVTSATLVGSYNVIVRASDNCAPGTGTFTDATFTVNVVCPTITLGALGNGTASTFYDQTVTANPAGGSYSFVQTGTLPPGLSFNGATGRLSGPPTTAGTFNFTITATGFGNCAQSRNYAVTIACPAITLSALPGAVAGTFYDQTVAANPTGGSYSFMQTGTLPPGLSFNGTTGRLSGTPTAAGTFNFTITATGLGNCIGSQAYSLTVACPTILLNPASLPAGTANTSYNQTLTASPSGTAYNYSFTSGVMPAGLTLNANGSFSGTPTQTGVFNFRVTVTGWNGCSGFGDYVLVISCLGATINPASLPGGTIGMAYSQTVSASPAGTYSYAVTSGALPTGLMLNAATGAITGTPTNNGSFSFRITATAGGCSGTRDYTVNIGCASVTITSASLAIGVAGSTYSQTIVVNPAGSYSFSLQSGNLPSGLTLNSTNGIISGLPSITGSFSFVIKATASTGCAATQSYSLQINCPNITLAALPTPTLNSPYNPTVTASPSGSSYNFAVTAGALPAGLSLNPATGLVSGTATTAGAYNFTITATGFGSCTGSRNYTGTITGSSCPTITLADLPAGEPGQLYSNTVTGTPSASYNYAVTAGSLPPGLTLYASAGLIFGFPTANGTYHFTITATDSNNCSGERAYTVVIGTSPFRSNATAANDFDGDGKSDLAVWRGQTSEWLIQCSSDDQLQTVKWGASYNPYRDVTVAADYDGDGKTDIAVFRRGNGHWYIRQSSDGKTLDIPWGMGLDVPVPADYDGDGKADIAVWRGSEGNWYVRRSSDDQVDIINWGSSATPYNDVAVPGDYDGDGITDIAVFRSSTGHWFIKRSSDGVVVDKYWGMGTDVPVPADYDGDGKTDIAVWRGSDTNWYIVRSSDSGTQIASWGASSLGDIPLPGDYDGDGKIDLAVWRVSNQTWYIRSSADNSVLAKAQGQVGDAPVRAPRQ